MGRELIDLHALDPLGVVDVLDIAPDVLACAWVEGRELHVVDRGDGRGLFIAVEDSASASTGRQLMLTGREGVPASDTIWASWLRGARTAVDRRRARRYHRPRVEANEGDLMLLNEQPVLVALSPGPVERNRAGWEHDLLDLRSGEREPVLRWGDRAGAHAGARARARDRVALSAARRRGRRRRRRARSRAARGSAPRARRGAAGCTCTRPARARS